MIGADVEQFLLERSTGLIVPCVGILPGTKQHPHPLETYGNFVQEDNVMVEWNISPHTDAMEFTWAVEAVQDEVQEFLDAEYPDTYRLDYKIPAHEFRTEQLFSDQAQTIGCEPDYDAYTGGKVRNNLPKLSNWRSCGGHIHLGGDFQCPDFVAALFAELFISVKGDIRWPDSPRKQWYGRPGVFRPKPYGIEYRTPDNSWTFDREDTESVAYNAMACTSYLTRTAPEEIHAHFRQFPWLQMKEWMELPLDTLDGSPQKMRRMLIATAAALGIPV
jgi:hypothetical protein